ncbi:MAG TPA: peptide ABC transporter substrate-binding protein [Alphaproteobacteria bacterium]|nr:peptide ABC transporter substrate-binding protein [Alphaproteobacteria bacterium]HAJ46899.1 peptide ABC transporter substrate-binding protein [Alphaproteobacteria bacterium]
MIRAMTILVMWLTCSHTFANPVFHRGNLAEPQSLDPQKFSMVVENQILFDLFLGLLTYDAFGRPAPGLAESWTISPDEKVYTFKLRPNLTWSDGKPITADDAVFGLQRAVDPATQGWFGNFLSIIKGADDITAGKAKPDTLGVRAVDPGTVEIALTKPAPVILKLLAGWSMTYPVPKHAVVANPQGWARAGVMVSSGPYTLMSWRVSDKIVLTKNARFHDAANIAVPEVHYYPTTDDTAALNRFRAGELDFNPRFPPNQIDWLRRNLPRETKTTPAQAITYLVFNLKRKPFDDIRVRRALALAIDRQIITDKILRNGEQPYCGMVPSTIESYRPACNIDNRPIDQRRAEARQLLQAAGFGPNAPLNLELAQRQGQTSRLMSIAVAGMWSEIGVETDIQQSEVAVHYNNLREGNFSVADAGWFGSPDPFFFTYLLKAGSTESNYGAYVSAPYEAQVVRAEATMNPSARYEAFRQAEAIALGDVPVVPLFIPVHRTLIKPYVKGIEVNATGYYVSRYTRIEQAVGAN